MADYHSTFKGSETPDPPSTTQNLHHAIPKKSRATSCTSCRQVKLKCNVKEVYPQPCSRCQSNKLECKMDASFKRVPARHRIKELTNQLDQMKRMKTLDTAVEPPDIALRPHPETAGGRRTSDFSNNNTNQHGGSITSNSSISPSASSSLSHAKFLLLNELSTPKQWRLGDVTISQEVVLDLFHQFEEFYYPHFCILEPVTSLTKLSRDSSLLFWTILQVASRHHPRHDGLAKPLREAHAQVMDQAGHEAIQSLLDLQAVLLMCTWPNAVKHQLSDPSWMQLGMAVNAARQMGLDKPHDDVLFGSRHAKFTMKKHPPEILKMTWMKCFQLDVQMSTWLGHLPLLSSAPCLRIVSAYCEDAFVQREFAAAVKIQHQVARFTVTLGDGFASRASMSSLVRMFDQGLGTVKTNYISHWSVNTEMMLLAAKLHLYALCLATDHQDDISSTLSDETVFISEILQASHTAAVRLITLMTELGASTIEDPPCASYEAGGTPCLAYPKNYFRSAFFAAVILLKYLDFNRYASPQDMQEARNAISANYQMFIGFRSSSQHMDAAVTLEVLGRSIGPDHGKLKTHVTTRLSASLMYNAIWLAASLRGRDRDREYSTNVPSSTEQIPVTYSSFQPTNPTTAWLDPTEGLSVAFMDPAASQQFPNAEFAFPFGVWDNSVYDLWAAGSVDGVGSNWDLSMDTNLEPLW